MLSTNLKGFLQNSFNKCLTKNTFNDNVYRKIHLYLITEVNERYGNEEV